jgi:hypothetical protein
MASPLPYGVHKVGTAHQLFLSIWSSNGIVGSGVGISQSPAIGERNNGEFHGERWGPAQPTEKTLGKSLKSALQQGLGELPAFALRLSRPNETHSVGLPAGPFGIDRGGQHESGHLSLLP